jgi:hypothetical protein
MQNCLCADCGDSEFIWSLLELFEQSYIQRDLIALSTNNNNNNNNNCTFVCVESSPQIEDSNVASSLPCHLSVGTASTGYTTGPSTSSSSVAEILCSLFSKSSISIWVIVN